MSEAMDLLMDCPNHPVERWAGQQLQIRTKKSIRCSLFFLIDRSNETYPRCEPNLFGKIRQPNEVSSEGKRATHLEPHPNHLDYDS